MLLEQGRPVAFIPTPDPQAARAFYEHKLGLSFESEGEFAVIFRTGAAPGTMLRLARIERFNPAEHTVFGWQVPDLDLALDELAAKGIAFLRYDFLSQDARGVWQAPGGVRVAWFKDPDGNILSVSQNNAAQEV